MQINKFISEVLNEMKFVKWPTRKMVISTTIMVVVVSIFAAMLLGGSDYGLQKLLTKFAN